MHAVAGDRRITAVRVAQGVGALMTVLFAAGAAAAVVDLPTPLGSAAFGTAVAVLPNGNIVVTDPIGPVSSVGAVYVFTPAGVLLSSLTGSSANDQVGDGGIRVLANGNFVVISSHWNNGAASNAGAVTWVNGNSGLSGVVSAANSLVGTLSGDRVGDTGVTALGNGNFIVGSLYWHGVSAITWGSGSGGTTGAVAVSNSLIGSASHDYLGTSVVELANGNVVIGSPHWNAETGAATWMNGATGSSGAVSASNSLVGAHSSSNVGAGLLALSNGHYVVLSPSWSATTGPTYLGAATWANGGTGLTGTVTAANSLTGSSANDQVGTGAVALTNGNYVVASQHWHNGATADAGAVTWVDGTTGLSGSVVSAVNSLVGTSTADAVGSSITALANGHYVIASTEWNNGALARVGAITWGNGNSGVSGPLSAVNSLLGTTQDDRLGAGRVVALSNGNFVVASPHWHNGAIAEAGAATWANGAAVLTGTVTSANSLVGVATGDAVGSGGITALLNGNYVVGSPAWSNGPAASVGAATWGSGSAGVKGVITATNSLLGALGADAVGSGGIVALANGHYLVGSPAWDSPLAGNIGAVTWCNGLRGRTGTVSIKNSLVGQAPGDGIGGAMVALSDGKWLTRSPVWDNGATADAGAVTFSAGTHELKGFIASWNSVQGTVAAQGASLTHAYDAARSRLVVGKPAENRVSLFTLDQLFADGFE